MAGAKKYVDEFIESLGENRKFLTEMRVSTPLWRMLVTECAPQDPEEVYGVPFVLDDVPPVHH